jgi:hypothetical protein
MTRENNAGLPALQTSMERREQDYAMAFQKGYRRTLLALIRSSRRYDLAEDLAQAAWLRAWERWHQCQSPDPVPWIIGIALNMLRDEIKRSSRYCRLGPEHDRPTSMAVDVRAIDVDRILNNRESVSASCCERSMWKSAPLRRSQRSWVFRHRHSMRECRGRSVRFAREWHDQ